MASLQARHSRACAIGKPWTPFEKVDGCTCKPTYYVVVRDGSKVSREKAGKNRIHLDLAPDDQQAEVERLLALGARRVDIGQGDVSWVVMADPEGNEFCAFPPQA